MNNVSLMRGLISSYIQSENLHGFSAEAWMELWGGSQNVLDKAITGGGLGGFTSTSTSITGSLSMQI